MISRKGRLTLILLLISRNISYSSSSIVSKGSVSNENTGGDGSGLGDVRIKVFIDGDVA